MNDEQWAAELAKARLRYRRLGRYLARTTRHGKRRARKGGRI